MSSFDRYIGIDYSGSGTPLTRIPGLQVYVATNDRLPRRLNPPSTPAGRNRNWCRKEVAEWLIEQANSQFDVQGQVAKSTHAGIPWLHQIRSAVGKKVHFWPFDGWTVRQGKSVIAEVFPSMLRRRYPAEGRTVDQHDAYAIARWLRRRSLNDRYLDPAMTERDRKVAELEGWILGVM